MDMSSVILKRDVRGRVRTPVERREQVVAEYQRSGLALHEFARLAGIHYNTFWNWLQKAGLTRKRKVKKPPAQPSAGLSLVEVRPQALAAVAVAVALRVQLPGGGELLVEDAGQVTLAAQLIKALI